MIVVRRRPVVAALFVESDGPYKGERDVVLHDIGKDARNYHGPYPVVAHPPCASWSILSAPREALYGLERGEDDGCFESALSSARTYGGVVEHPAFSSAWKEFGIIEPPTFGGWVSAGFCGGWTCCVSQYHYGHASRKMTWLYAHGCVLPVLKWGVPGDAGALVETMTKRERKLTPEPFKRILLRMARSQYRNDERM